MHQSVMTWLAERGAEFGDIRSWDVIEIGSFNENGSPREIFGKVTNSYTGIDMREGLDKGVDIVAHADNLPLGNHCADLVISTEMLEHDQRPWKSIPEMARILRVGGRLLLTARGFDEYHGCYPEHPCPGDFWRFNIHSMNVLIRDAGLKPVTLTRDPEVPGVFAHAVKP